MIAIYATGIVHKPKKKGAFIYTKLKSFDTILIVLPNSPLFAVYWVKENILVKMTDIKHDRNFPEKIGP